MDTPMVHWPESMFTYLPEDRLLFSMDAFGQHLATSGRFDDETPLTTIMDEAKTYFANILMLYARPIANTLAKAATLPVSIVAPSHGVIWRRHFPEVFKAYQEWVSFKPARKVVIAFDTMWGSTDRMARAIAEGAAVSGVDVIMLSIRRSHITDLAAEVLDAAALAVGSPTLNMTMMPEIASALTYLKGLKPMNKAGLAFGSYGWGLKGGAQVVEEYLKAMDVEILRPALQVQFAPDAPALAACREAGLLLAERAMRA